MDNLSFWNSVFANQKPEKIIGKWVMDDNFNEIIKKYIKKNSCILDYGCGAGWALFEIYYTVQLEKGIGMDPSVNAIAYANQCRELSDTENLSFIQGDESLLLKYVNYFDSIVTFNVIDVLEDEVINRILQQMVLSLKKDGYLLIGINPDYPFSLLESLGYQKVGHYLYKNGILRGNEKSIEEWKKLFSKYFSVISTCEFALEEREKNYPRRMFILQK